MGISKPEVLEIARNTYAINEFGMATCFLLAGTERGLLIDTGCGMYNIREIADELCKVPYDVVLTHAHGDHFGSMDKWDEVYMHPDDFGLITPELDEFNRQKFARYPGMMKNFGTFDAYDITPEQLHYPEKTPKFIPCEEGHVFDLGGGRKVDVVHTPGHTPGEIVLIDPTTRILFSGDACNVNLGIFSTSINTALKGLLKVKAREADFDRNFNGHIGYGGSNVNRSMPESVLDDCLSIMRHIIAGTADVKTRDMTFIDRGIQASVREGHALITYDPNRIIDEGEEPAE
ncbi:MAG: MBL fold metallo-hydrolase [Solobacterium sp.]|nr:MBL fold metallo-hydrolase [Solobacterium sp.]